MFCLFFCHMHIFRLLFRLVTQPLIQSLKKLLPSSSTILATRTQTFRQQMMRLCTIYYAIKLIFDNLTGDGVELSFLHQVKDADRVQTLGNLTIPLSRLLSNSNLSLDQWFQLENSGSASRIYLNAILRVNGTKTYDPALL